MALIGAPDFFDDKPPMKPWVPLAIAWGVVLTMMIGTAVGLQLTYDPADHAVRRPVAASRPAVDTSHDATQPVPNGADPTDNHADNSAAELPADPPATIQTDPVVDAIPDPGPQQPAPRPVEAPVQTIVLAAVDPALIRDTRNGPLPIIADGREPWKHYARPYTAGGAGQRIALIITGAGLNGRQTKAAVEDLPGPVAIAFSPYGKNLDSWRELARLGGHETLLMVPMEPLNYPRHDPGPLGLLTTHSPRQNIDRLLAIMGKTQGYVGLINHMGSRFVTLEDGLTPVMQEIKRRGLLFVDSRTSAQTLAAAAARRAGVPRVMSDRYIDNNANAEDIDRYLAELEAKARAVGYAVGIGRPYPITIERINRWAETALERGYELVPITAVANRQLIR